MGYFLSPNRAGAHSKTCSTNSIAPINLALSCAPKLTPTPRSDVCVPNTRTVNSECYKSFDPDHWNACLKVLCRPFDTLDSVQRPAALVLDYYGRVMNGGHSLHFDVRGDTRDEELLRALKELGAFGHARILAEAFFLRREARRSRGGDDYVSDSIEELDLQFGRLKPDIPELLARYFKAHPESFQQERPA